MTHTRRRFLARSSAALAAASLAGCLGGGAETTTDAGGDGPAGDGPDGDGSAGGDGTATTTSTGQTGDTSSPDATSRPTGSAGSRPATPNANYAEWLPAPGAVEFADDAGYAFRSMAPAALDERADSLGEGALDGFYREVASPGIETLADATTLHQFARSASVYEADFDRANVESEFEALGFSAAGTHRGFTVFTGGDARAGAVGDDAVVTAGRVGSGDDVEKRPAVETIIDARAGDADRYVDVDADCERLVDALGDGHVLQGRTHEAGATFDGAVGEGIVVHVGEGDTRLRASVVFEAGSVDEDAVADWASEADAFSDREPLTSADGRVVDAAALAPTGEVTSFPGEFPGPPIESEVTTAPQVQFEFDYEGTGEDRGVVTVTHSSGDAVSASELYVAGSGFADVESADQTAAGEWQGTVSGDDGAVFAGDAVDVGVASDAEVRVVWRAEDRDVSTTLAAWRGPDA